MQVKWKKLLAKTVVWLASEILLNFLEIDNLADYSEFIFDRGVVALEADISRLTCLEV